MTAPASVRRRPVVAQPRPAPRPASPVPTVRLLGSKIDEATIAPSGTILHEAIRSVILIAARQEVHLRPATPPGLSEYHSSQDQVLQSRAEICSACLSTRVDQSRILFGNELGHRIVSIFYRHRAFNVKLISISRSPCLLGARRNVLQQSVDGHWCLQAVWRSE